jgi:hypothetical protein
MEIRIAVSLWSGATVSTRVPNAGKNVYGLGVSRVAFDESFRVAQTFYRRGSRGSAQTG